MESNLEAVANLLRASIGGSTGVAQLSRTLRTSPSALIALVASLQDEGLLETGRDKRGKPGRPKRWVRTTALGLEFVAAYRALASKALRSRRSDLLRAAADGRYARRLSDTLSTNDIFLEISELARRS